MANLQLAKNLYTLRKAHNLTQKQVSTYLNISRQAYSNYETSKRAPDLDSLIRMSQLYNVTLDTLVNQNIGNQFAEQKGPYQIGLSITTGDTIYLTNSELDLIMNYRNLSSNNKKVLDGFISSHLSQPHKKSNN